MWSKHFSDTMATLTGNEDLLARFNWIKNVHWRCVSLSLTCVFSSVCYHPSGFAFATGSEDKTARLFDLRSDQVRHNSKTLTFFFIFDSLCGVFVRVVWKFSHFSRVRGSLQQIGHYEPPNKTSGFTSCGEQEKKTLKSQLESSFVSNWIFSLLFQSILQLFR